MYSSFTSSKTKTRQFSRSGTFADLLVRHVRSRGGYAPAVYSAARIDRRTYSSIVSHPFRPVAKRTAIQFALALRLDRKDADALLRSAGFALSPAIPRSSSRAKPTSRGRACRKTTSSGAWSSTSSTSRS